MAENPRIEELRRRVDSDPASIAFAQLAEEMRRSGDHEHAVRVCRAGLAHHPSYLSARVTLGRALIELHRYDEAHAELEQVLQTAPENLAALRGVAEIHQRRGNLVEALRVYQIALSLAKHDAELEEAVLDLNRRLGTHAARGAAPALQGSGAEGRADTPAPESAAVPLAALSPALEAAADEFTKALQALDALSLDLSANSPHQRASSEGSICSSRDAALVSELESWLDSIVKDRETRSTRL